MTKVDWTTMPMIREAVNRQRTTEALNMDWITIAAVDVYK